MELGILIVVVLVAAFVFMNRKKNKADTVTPAVEAPYKVETSVEKQLEVFVDGHGDVREVVKDAPKAEEPKPVVEAPVQEPEKAVEAEVTKPEAKKARAPRKPKAETATKKADKPKMTVAK